MKECFESQDIGKLQEAIRSMPESEARYHMKRCVDSGLWVPAHDDEQTNPEDGFVIKRDEEVNIANRKGRLNIGPHLKPVEHLETFLL